MTPRRRSDESLAEVVPTVPSTSQTPSTGPQLRPRLQPRLHSPEETMTTVKGWEPECRSPSPLEAPHPQSHSLTPSDHSRDFPLHRRTGLGGTDKNMDTKITPASLASLASPASPAIPDSLASPASPAMPASLASPAYPASPALPYSLKKLSSYCCSLIVVVMFLCTGFCAADRTIADNSADARQIRFHDAKSTSPDSQANSLHLNSLHSAYKTLPSSESGSSQVRPSDEMQPKQDGPIYHLDSSYGQDDVDDDDDDYQDGLEEVDKAGVEEERRQFEDCPECERRRKMEARFSETEIRKVRIELIKNRILSNLRLPHRPNITASRATIPSQLLKFLEFEETHRKKRPRHEDDAPKSTQVFLFGEGLANSCRQFRHSVGVYSACFYLPFKDELFGKKIKSAELFVYQKDLVGKKEKPRLSVLGVKGQISGDDALHHRRVRHSLLVKTLASQERRIQSSGWVKFDLKRAFKRLNDRLNVNISLIINCTNCGIDAPFPVSTAEGERPFLKLHTVETGNRHKRSIECTKNTQHCCREKFYISFSEIGWDDWIIAPTGYMANYCTGSCAGLTEPIFHHSSVLAKAKSLDINERLKQSLAPCCTPKKMAPASLLYRADGEKIFQQNLHNMVVEECGCA